MLNTRSAEPSSLRVFKSGQILRKDGLHRVFSPCAIENFCPSSKQIVENVMKIVYSNTPIAFGREVFISVLKPGDLRKLNWDDKRRCGLSDCSNYIPKHGSYGYAAIIYPECHIFSSFPFLPASNFPSSKGLIICGLHCKISSDPSLASVIENSNKVFA